MQASSVDMTVQETNRAIADRIRRLAAGEDIPPTEE
jgi:hypothetical protein